MALDAEELVIRPLREVVQRGNEAITKAGDAIEENKSQGHDATAIGLAKAGQILRKEGERALHRLQPLWDAQVAKHGDGFKRLVVHDGEVVEKRRKLEDLLYDFEDFIEVDTFDEPKFEELRVATKSLALAVMEVIRSGKIESTRGEPKNGPVFPPLPPLPPLPHSMAARPGFRSMNSAQSLSRSPVNGKESWPRPPSSNRHRAGSRDMYAHASGGDIVPPLPSMTLQFMTPHENGHADDTIVPGHAAPVPPSNDLGRTEMLRVQLERARIMVTPPTSPKEENGMALGHGISFNTREGTFYSDVVDAPASPQHGRTHDDEGSVPDVASANAKSNRTSVLSGTTSLSSRPGRGLSISEALQPPSTRRTSASIPASTASEASGARVRSSLSETGSQLEKWSTGTTTDSYLATAMGYPKWRSVNNKIDSKTKTKGACAGAESFRTGGHWDGVKKVGGGSGSTSQANEYSFGMVYSSSGPVYTDAMAQCKSCEYTHKHSELSQDFDGDATANYTADTIRYRRRFLYKSHVTTHNMSKAYYVCVFCSSTGEKIHESDATLFATPAQLFAHLARHPQPLPEVTGMMVLYGSVPSDHPRASNYDINLTRPTISNRIPEDASLGYLPVAVAAKDHFQEAGTSKLPQPDRDTKVLQFFAGGRIVGVEFPQKWNGKWGSGWHDGEFGAFPAKVINLEAPRRKGMRPLSTMDSRRSGVARWKFKPKSGSSVSWLELDKGDLITNLNWDDSEGWYWSGTNNKGQTGIFPSSHMDIKSVQDGSLEADGARPTSKKTSRPKKDLFRFKRTSTASS